MTKVVKPFVLLICDGWGENQSEFGNAIRTAHTPNMDALRQRWPHTTVAASGEAVGLPDGQQGNSEVGHLTIGAGRVIRQPLTRQHHEIETGSFYQNEVLITAIELAKQRGTSLHILGLVSPGGVHSHTNGAVALAKLAAQLGLDRVHIHAFTDGRDTPPKSALEHMKEFEAELATIGVGKVASISGRYYAMDRDNRWERIEQAYDVLVGNEHPIAGSATDYIASSYERGENDEFLKPVAIASTPEDHTHLNDGDVVVFFNFRPDRARQLSHALVDKEFNGFTRRRVLKDLHFVSFAEYDETLDTPIAFPKQYVVNSLAEVVGKAGLRHYHVAETEKYAHVTYYINGGREEPFAGEMRELIPSSKVATYDLKPEMSAAGVADAAIKQLQAGNQDLIIVNFANADMVGHTGVFEATRQAVEVLDGCIGRIVEVTLAQGGGLLMTADHGCAEHMIDPETNEPLTAHTTNPVPVILCGTEATELRDGGELSDIAPTVLEIIGLPIPANMTGKSLLL
jgi:2,3-bisphosphoglycerate-independent phosphoglycerate mutase